MHKIARQQDHHTRESWVLIILNQLSRIYVERLMWPSSPLLVLLDCMVACHPFYDSPLGGIHQPLWFNCLAKQTYPDDHCIWYASQILLANQLVKFGIDVNTGISDGSTPLHNACCSTGVINLEYIEFLLQSGTDPNAKDRSRRMSLTYTIDRAPGAAKASIEWPATDVDIVSRSRISLLVSAHMAKLHFRGATESLAHERPRRAVEDQFILQQWLEVEAMLVERGAQ
jgi:hypothetical protein